MNLNIPPLPQPRATQAQNHGRRRAARWRLWALLLLAAAGGTYLLSSRLRGAHMPSAEASPVTARPGIPVAAARARLGDLHRYLSALGTVKPLNTVTVRSRVDGQLMKVAFREGQIVHQGDLLFQIDPRPYQVQLEQAKGALARDKATLANARLMMERYRTLLKQNVIARQDYDNQVALVGQYQGTIISDQAAIDNARLQLTYCRITAPITGRIGLRLVDPGNIVHATDTQGLAVITQLRPIAILFSIPEDDLPQVRKDLRSGQTLPVDAYDRALKTKLSEGKLLTFNNQIDPTTGTVRLKASSPNQHYALFPNQFVNVKLLVDTERGVVLVPTAAVQRSSLGAFVYVIKPDNTVEVRKVTLGASEGDISAVQSGLGQGDLVVVEGVDRLREGSKVRVRKLAAAAPSGFQSGLR